MAKVFELAHVTSYRYHEGVTFQINYTLHSGLQNASQRYSNSSRSFLSSRWGLDFLTTVSFFNADFLPSSPIGQSLPSFTALLSAPGAMSQVLYSIWLARGSAWTLASDSHVYSISWLELF